MGQEDKNTKHNQTLFWRGVLSLLALVIAYSLYSGVSLKKIEVPGVFNAEFSPSSDNHDNHTLTPSVTLGAGTATATASAPAPSATVIPVVTTVSAPATAPAAVSSHIPHDDVADDYSSPRAATTINLNGVWFSAEGLQYNISHQGNSIALQEINPLLGGMITAEGQGSIDGRQIDMELNTLLGIAGYAELEVSADGQLIQGSYTAEGSYQSMPLQLYRQN